MNFSIIRRTGSVLVAQRAGSTEDCHRKRWHLWKLNFGKKRQFRTRSIIIVCGRVGLLAGEQLDEYLGIRPEEQNQEKQ